MVRKTAGKFTRTTLRLEPLEDRRLLATIPVAVGDGYSLGIDDSETFAVLQMEQDEYDSFAADPTYSNNTQRIYETFQDEFDFIFFVPNETQGQANFSGQAVRIQNDVDGIGVSQYDSTATYGSDGRLQSAIYLATRDALRSGPSLHEIMHRWANRYPEFLPQQGHWGYSNVGGQLGGWAPGTLNDLGGGNYEADGPEGHAWFSTFANGGNGVPFSEFELYLMGLVEAGDVSHDIKIARDGATVNFSDGTFTASSIDTYTMNQLVAANGLRSPAPQSAQTEFRSLVVLVTPEVVSDEIATEFADDITQFSIDGDNGISWLYNFWEATGGRATMQMDGLLDLIDAPVDGTDRIGVHRANLFLMDVNGDDAWSGDDASVQFGVAASTPIIGDWDGDGIDNVGVHRGNGFWLDQSGDGNWGAGDVFYRFGQFGNTPVSGDWDGDGRDEIGVHHGNGFWLDRSGDGAWGAGDSFHRFGQHGNTPVIGDWNGDGVDQLGVHSLGRFYLDVSGDAVWNPGGGDKLQAFGRPTSTPLSGDFDGDGVDSVGVQDGNRFWLDQNGDGVWSSGDRAFAFGLSTDTAIVGNWRTPLQANRTVAARAIATNAIARPAITRRAVDISTPVEQVQLKYESALVWQSEPVQQMEHGTHEDEAVVSQQDPSELKVNDLDQWYELLGKQCQLI